jgi:hypothetical protein
MAEATQRLTIASFIGIGSHTRSKCDHRYELFKDETMDRFTTASEIDEATNAPIVVRRGLVSVTD